MSADTERWVDVGSVATLTEQGRLDVELAGEWIAVVRLDGTLHAFEDRCTHDGEPLAEAELDADPAAPCGVVICPRHGARFCLQTGAALTPPAYEPLRIFAVRERADRVELRSP